MSSEPRSPRNITVRSTVRTGASSLGDETRFRSLGVSLLFGVGLAFVALGAPSPAAAQSGPFFDEFATSARTGGMGQAFTGLADDPSAAYYNPGGLGFVADQTYIGWHYSKPRLDLNYEDPAKADVHFDVPPTRGLSVGKTSHLAPAGLREEFPWLEAFHWGGAVFLSLPEINSFRSYADETTPYFFRYDTRPDVLSIAISAGWQALEWLSIGAGVMTTVSSFQTTAANVRLPELVCAIIENPPPQCGEFPQPDPTKGLDLSLQQRLPAELTPVAGLLVKVPTPFLASATSLGFSWRGEIGNDFGTGPETTSFGYRDPETGVFVPIIPKPGQPPPVIPIINFIGFSPQQYSFGIGLHPTADLTVDVDGTYKIWSAFRQFQETKPDPPFEDRFVPRIGAEYRIPFPIEHWLLGLREVHLRAGYTYEPTPNPSLDGRTNILDSNQHVVAGGIGIGTRFIEAANLRLDLFYQVHLLQDRARRNDLDATWGRYEFGGDVWSFGMEGNVDW